MRSWSIEDLDVRSGQQEVLFSSDDSRALALRVGAGERLACNQIHKRAWIMPVSGEIEVTSAGVSPIRGGPGLVIELDAKDRHEVVAREDAHLLLLLTPGSGIGRPGSIPVAVKRPHPARAIDQAEPPIPSPSADDDDPWSLDPLSPLPRGETLR
jgi:hypothetical protein